MIKKAWCLILIVVLGVGIVERGSVNASVPEDNCSTLSNKLRFVTDSELSGLSVGDNLMLKLVLDNMDCGGIVMLNMRIKFDKIKLSLKTVSLKGDFSDIAGQIDEDGRGVVINNDEGYVDIFALVDIENNGVAITSAGIDDALMLFRFEVIEKGSTLVYVDHEYADLLVMGVDQVGNDARFDEYWNLRSTERSQVSADLGIGVCGYDIDFVKGGGITIQDFTSYRLAFIDVFVNGVSNPSLEGKLNFNCDNSVSIADFAGFRSKYLQSI